MKTGDNPAWEYGPVLCVVLLMVFVMVYTFLPSFQMNGYLNRVRDQRLKEIRAFKKKEMQSLRMIDALERDPITVENHLRRRFGGAKRKGEVDVDRLAQ